MNFYTLLVCAFSFLGHAHGTETSTKSPVEIQRLKIKDGEFYIDFADTLADMVMDMGREAYLEARNRTHEEVPMETLYDLYEQKHYFKRYDTAFLLTLYFGALKHFVTIVDPSQARHQQGDDFLKDLLVTSMNLHQMGLLAAGRFLNDVGKGTLKLDQYRDLRPVIEDVPKSLKSLIEKYKAEDVVTRSLEELF